MNMLINRYSILVVLFVILSIVFYVQAYARVSVPIHSVKVLSVDTMKYSRDVAREKNYDASFDEVIDRQISQIASLGATHVSIATPYDIEFNPFLKRWVNSARKHSINVWFRGNFSGWEGWFGYSKLAPEEHTKQIEQFILKNKDLFKDGDIFTSCPECENGGPGDPRYGDVKAYRNFLIHEYQTTKKTFVSIGKKVTANYYSMNGDVAKIVMDKETVKALDGVITIDHYVSTPDALVKDIHEYAKRGAAKMVLGETGVPIPDINGKMSEDEQAVWLSELFTKLSNTTEVIGINYWANIGSSTALWNNDGTPRKGVNVLRNFFKQQVVKTKVVDSDSFPVSGATISVYNKTFLPAKNGMFTLPYFLDSQIAVVAAPGYKSKQVTFENIQKIQTIVLTDGPSKIQKKRSWISRLINFFTSSISL